MKWSRKKSEKQEQIDIIEAAVVSAAFLVFMYYGMITNSFAIVISDILITSIILYTSYVLSEYRKRLEKYREGIKKIEIALVEEKK